MKHRIQFGGDTPRCVRRWPHNLVSEVTADHIQHVVKYLCEKTHRAGLHRQCRCVAPLHRGNTVHNASTDRHCRTETRMYITMLEKENAQVEALREEISRCKPQMPPPQFAASWRRFRWWAPRAGIAALLMVPPDLRQDRERQTRGHGPGGQAAERERGA